MSANSMSPILEAIGLEVSIAGAQILRGVSLSVTERAICGLVGRNGAGKTTFLRAAMGLLPSTGTFLFGGRDLSDVRSYHRAREGIGYMPEDRRLVPALSAEENILIPAWANKHRDIRDRLAWVYEVIPDLAEFRTRAATELSGGQQKLVALGRALMAGRRLLLLDEPTEGVAPALAAHIAEILSSLKNAGVSALVAGSDDTYLSHVFDQKHVLERGAIVPAKSGHFQCVGEEAAAGERT